MTIPFDLPATEPVVQDDGAPKVPPTLPKAAPEPAERRRQPEGEKRTGGRAARTKELLDGLNTQQREAVLHRDSPLLIVAGAGSGKTRVLTHRIGYLLAERNVHPGQILAITFTNKAAGEMRERVAGLVGKRAEYMWVSTFHSACARILRYESSNVGIRNSFTIYDAADSQRMMALVCRELDLDPKRYPPRAFTSRVSALKNELIDEETYASRAAAHQDGTDETLAEAYSRYQARLRQANALDFDDIIMTTVNVLQAFPQVSRKYRERFRHVMVDEYQDTNHAQYVLIRELVGHDDPETIEGRDAPEQLPIAELTVVGDADQSIYAFRGATIRNIQEFESDYPQAKTILLEQNYRSTQNILQAANAVISKNPDRRPKNLWSDAGAGEKIVGYVADNEHDEAAFIVEEIERLRREGLRFGDIAAFYRTNAQSRALEEVLVRTGVPYRVVGGTRFYERREIKDALAYLRVLVNPTDTVNLRRILNVPKRGIGDRAEACVAFLAERDGVSFNAALERAQDAPGIATRSLSAIRGFTDLIARLRELVEAGETPGVVLEAVLDQSGYVKELQNSQDPQDETRVENLEELVSVAHQYAQENPDGTLVDFLEGLSLVADADQIPDEAVAAGEAEEHKTDDGVVTLMTLHTAKGLEFDVVFLTGVEEGVFPHLRSLDNPTELAEERRLAYVGITRARKRLYISRSITRGMFGSMQYFPASRFIKEIPEELIDWRRDIAARDVRLGQAPSVARLASRSGVRSPGNRPIVHLVPGDRVTHDTFGLGTVIRVDGEGDRAQATINFSSQGEKRLMLRYARVEKL